jgi:hypothetical protein
VVLGILFGFALVRNVLAADATARPHRTYFVFEPITAVYHLGYAQFREDGVGGPET